MKTKKMIDNLIRVIEFDLFDLIDFYPNYNFTKSYLYPLILLVRVSLFFGFSIHNCL